MQHFALHKHNQLCFVTFRASSTLAQTLLNRLRQNAGNNLKSLGLFNLQIYKHIKYLTKFWISI